MARATPAGECSSCRRHRATYARRQSGEKLCAICLYRDLVREVKRSFSLAGKKGYGLKVGVLVDSRRLIESVVLMKLLGEVEREFGGKVVGIVTDEVLIDCLPGMRRYCENVVIKLLEEELSTEDPDIESLYNALGMKLDVLAYPATLNDLLTFFLKSLAFRYEIRKPKVYARYREVEFIAPMHRILRTDILAYALISRIIDDLNCLDLTTKEDTLDKFSAQLSLEHPELLYRFLYSMLGS